MERGLRSYGGTGATLRSTELATQTGGRATIGSMIGEDGKAVVIFLRHLG